MVFQAYPAESFGYIMKEGEQLKIHTAIGRVCQDDISYEQREIMHGMYKNLPVRYKDGIFRVSKLCEAVEESRKIWEVEIEETFTSEDPNGRESNGWKEEEIADNSSREVSSDIAELEV